MRWIIAAALFTCAGTGCSLLGYHKHQRAERAPPEEAAKVEFPHSLEGGVQLSGPMMAALQVAAKEFLPPGASATGHDEQLNQCLSRWETFDISVLQAREDLFFVRIFPVISRCGISDIVLDAGAVYAIDGKGRVLDAR